MSVASKTVLLLLGGAAIGATAALLTAPTSGREARRKLKQLSGDLAHKVSRVAPAMQEAYRKASLAGKEAFAQKMNGSALQAEAIPPQHH
jgi:gas vesicle protein